MKTPICFLLAFAVPSLGRADVVLQWNEVTLTTIQRTSTPPPAAARALAMVHLAIYDSVNSIDHTREAFRVYAPDSPSTSPEAASVQAAFRVLLHLFPSERAQLERAQADSLSRIEDESGKAAGIRLGEIVAQRIIAWREGDGAQRSISYAPGLQPGQWRPTPPDYKPAMLPQWRYLRPFGIPSPSYFRSALPPELTSTEYARDLDEVRTIGAADSISRTTEQTKIALFWADGVDTVTPPGHWNRIAQTVSRSEGLSIHENARLFALLNAALADAAVVCWDMKFTCNLWRPITAIREADTDGNAATKPDPTWRPLLDTPPFPTCTSGHSTFSGAAAQVLALFFGRDDLSFTDRSQNSRRKFASFSQAADEAGRSRIYGGIHFEFDNAAGLQSGRAVGRHIFDHYFRSLGASPADGALTHNAQYRRSAIEGSTANAPTYYEPTASFYYANRVTAPAPSVRYSDNVISSYAYRPLTYSAPVTVYAGDSIIVPASPRPTTVHYCEPAR